MLRKLAMTLAVTLFSVSASYADEWVRLGDRNVGFINDHDVIHVGRQDGKFKRLKLIVRRNDLKLNSIKVFYANGEVEDVVFDRLVRDGGEAVIDLPHGWHDGRFIRDVELHYHSRPDFRGEALAELWGQEEGIAVTPVVYGHEWVRLGDRRVGFISDRDVIHVGRQDGKFTRLKLLVRGNDINSTASKSSSGMARSRT